MEPKLAICKCGEQWFWDWELDCYRYLDGNVVKTVLLTQTVDEDFKESTICVFQCKCGEVNSASYANPNMGEIVFSIEKWSELLFELNGLCWRGECRNCEGGAKCLEA